MRLVALALGALLALPATAHAGSAVFGSDFSSPANAVESHSADTVYWDGAAASPVTGQLRYVTIRGGVLPGGGLGDFRFVVLRPDASGAVKVAAIDQILHRLPTTTDPFHRTPNKGFDWKLCLNRGDHLGIWKIGHGEVRIFGDVPGSVTSWYENAAGIAAGNVFTGTPSADRELLMEVRVNSGRDAFSRCPGGYKDHLYRNLDVRSAVRLAGGGAVHVRTRCPGETYGGCFGRLAVRARIGGHEVGLGSMRFSIAPGRAVTFRLPLSAAHAAALRRRGSLPGKVVMKGHDDPSDQRNRNAPAPRPGRQSATSVVNVTLRAG